MMRFARRAIVLCVLLSPSAVVCRAAECDGAAGPSAPGAQGLGPYFVDHLYPAYYSSSCLYGYFDHVYGRGPVIDLGSATLAPGFRGYGPFGSIGYGLGLRPTSLIDTGAPGRAGRAWPYFGRR